MSPQHQNFSLSPHEMWSVSQSVSYLQLASFLDVIHYVLSVLFQFWRDTLVVPIH